MTAAQLAPVYHVSVTTIRRWAARDHWGRYCARQAADRHVTRYDVNDAETTRRRFENCW